MDNSSEKIHQIVDHLFREEYGKVVAYLTTTFGFHFLESAQDIAQDTLTQAYQSWSYHGLPQNPQGWIFKVAKNKALNWIKREQKSHLVYHQYHIPEEISMLDEIEDAIHDSMLKMVFACCHSAISVENQVALILNVLCGFSRKEMAHALLVNEETIKKRLFRAKKLIREQEIDLFETPKDISEQTGKINAVCIAIYLLFNEGYNSSHKDELIRKDLCFESMRLTQLMIKTFQTNTHLRALLACMYLHVARFDARIDDKGAIVLLQDQNRTLWNDDLIKMGLYHLSEASKGESLSTYHLEASIAAQHCIAQDFESTNWNLIDRFYQQLYRLKPSPVILLNLAIVSGILRGAEDAIQQLIYLKSESKQLKNYYLLYAVLGHFYLQKGNKHLALEHFQQAKHLTSAQKEIDLLNRKIASISSLD